MSFTSILCGLVALRLCVLFFIAKTQKRKGAKGWLPLLDRLSEKIFNRKELKERKEYGRTENFETSMKKNTILFIAYLQAWNLSANQVFGFGH